VASARLRRRATCCGSCGNGEDRRVFERWLEDQ
jgi:hypothetical protein